MKSPQKRGHQGNNNNHLCITLFWGCVLGAVVVMTVMNQKQVKLFTLKDGSVLTTATTITGSTATHTSAYAPPPRGVRSEPRYVRDSSSEEDAEQVPAKEVENSDSDESDDDRSENGPKSETEYQTGSNDRTSYERANRDSGGFFDDITDESWALAKERVKSRTNHFDPSDPDRGIDFPPQWYQENFEPDFTCTHERRIGGMGDGPKWVCDPHRLKKKKDCLIYSVGSEGNFMFEIAIMKEIGEHCEIHTFDPEIQGSPYGHLAPSGVNYHNWGFMSDTEGRYAQSRFYRNVDNSSGNFKTMRQTVEELGHVGREIDIFKIDCEGCEWTTYQGWFSSGATLRQILVEVHGTPMDKVNNFFTGMQDAGYVTFHKEPNIQYGGGECVEYALFKLEKSFFEED